MKQSNLPTTLSTTARATSPSTTKKISKQASLTPAPSAASSSASSTVGLDLGDRHSHFCVLDAGGEPREQGKVVMSPKDIAAFFARVAPARLVMEVGGQSPWVSRLAQAAAERPPTVSTNARVAIAASASIPRLIRFAMDCALTLARRSRSHAARDFVTPNASTALPSISTPAR